MNDPSSPNPVIDRCNETGKEIRATDATYMIMPPRGAPQLILHVDALEVVPMQERDYANRVLDGQEGFNICQSTSDERGIFDPGEFHFSISEQTARTHFAKCWDLMIPREQREHLAYRARTADCPDRAHHAAMDLDERGCPTCGSFPPGVQL